MALNRWTRLLNSSHLWFLTSLMAALTPCPEPPIVSSFRLTASSSFGSLCVRMVTDLVVAVGRGVLSAYVVACCVSLSSSSRPALALVVLSISWRSCNKLCNWATLPWISASCWSAEERDSASNICELVRSRYLCSPEVGNVGYGAVGRLLVGSRRSMEGVILFGRLALRMRRCSWRSCTLFWTFRSGNLKSQAKRGKRKC